MSDYFTYEINGEKILDIEKWCRERNERMISFRRTRREVNAVTGQMEMRVAFGQMPESFWNTLRLGPDEEWEELLEEAKE